MARTQHLPLYQSVFIYTREVYRLRLSFPKSIKHDLGQEVCASSIKLLKCVVVANGATNKDRYLSRLGQDFVTAGDPRCIVKSVDIETYKFKDVPARVALAEGEGDQSIAHWKQSHARFFAPSLEKWGIADINEAEVITEYFEVK